MRKIFTPVATWICRLDRTVERLGPNTLHGRQTAAVKLRRLLAYGSELFPAHMTTRSDHGAETGQTVSGPSKPHQPVNPSLLNMMESESFRSYEQHVHLGC